MSKTKYRLKETVAVAYRSTRVGASLERTPEVGWIVQVGSWPGWRDYGYSEVLSYDKAKAKLESLIREDEANEIMYARFREARKKPMRTVYPPLPDAEPK